MLVEYNQSYEEKIIKLWNRELKLDKINSKKFRRQIILDENYDPSLCMVYLKDGEPIGFILGIKRKFPYLERGLEEHRGFISVMFVDSRFHRQGIGSVLLHDVETKLFDMGATRITLAAYSPNYFMSGVDEEGYYKAKSFFNKKGYVQGDLAFSMCRNLHGFSVSDYSVKKREELEQRGYKFINFEAKFMTEILEFAAKEFGGGWKRNLLIAMQTNVAEETVILVLDPNNNIVGFCMRAIDGNPSRFGPIGISQKIRNKGVGGVLLELQMEEMCKRGIYHMYFLSTDVPGKRFYERYGLKTYRTFTSYDKEIKK